MAVDTPAKIAIIGAGPIGLEAALYARYLGYDVEVFEFREPCHRIMEWRDRRMVTPFSMNASRLGLSAIAAHESNYQPPAADSFLTYGEWFERYLKPLAETDLISDHLRRSVIVQSIGKVEITKTDTPSGEFDRGSWDFRLLLMQMGQCVTQSLTTADVVLDCGGCDRGYVGHGGIPAINEQFRESKSIDFALQAPERYAAKRVLVVGDQLETAEVVIALQQISPPASILWITPRDRIDTNSDPLPIFHDDPLPTRGALIATANELARQEKVAWNPGVWIEAIELQEDQSVVVQFSGAREDRQPFDAIVSHTGRRSDWSTASELQLDICPITDAPRPFANYLKCASPYLIEYPAPDAAALITSEPNYYVLGAKSFGRMPGFLYQHGLRQIRDVFTIIGDRATLDLYK